MSPEQRRRVEQLLSMLVLLPERQRREALLREAAADDPEVRAEVERALPGIAEESETVGRTVGAPSERPHPFAPIERIGRYRIESVIGEGGFGVVYLAMQESPVRRRVAIKVIKPGMDSAPVVKRFEAERQALAVMDHPCIAKVFDGGVTDRGLPYFVMEHVEGESITSFCDRRRLGLSERLALLARVCDAVHHAHTKGVAHRDLKPANILVALDGDGTPQPKVIDFGIAKALDRPLIDGAVFTEEGMLIGTPAYMSPEQAGASADIDTRSDVYSLGVILYELLTGEAPFDPRTLRAAGFAEMLRVIREVEPPRPSAKLSTMLSSSDARESTRWLAETRRTEPRALRSALRRDLDWVAMKCLEKDRSRRYSSASELAEEIRRFMRSEPVVAGPPGAAYRARKFVRRHRVGVTGAAMVTIALALGLAGTATGMVRARRALDAEQLALAAQREATERAEAEAELAASIESFLTDELLTAASPTKAGPDATVRSLLDAASPLVGRRFADRPLTEAGIRSALGRAYQAIGLLEEAAPHLEAAHRMFVSERGPSDARTIVAGLQHATLLWREGRTAEALAALDSLAAPDMDALMLQRANALKHAGRPEDAAPLYAQTLARRTSKLGPTDRATISVIYDIALNEEAQGRYEEAERRFEEALDAVRAHLTEDDPLVGESTSEFARFLSSRRNDTERAEPLYREAEAHMVRTLGEGHWRLTQVRTNLGRMLQRAGRFDEARPILEGVVRSYATTDSGRARRDGPTALEWLRAGLLEADSAAAVRFCEEIAAQMAETFGADDEATARARLSLTCAKLRGGGNAELEAQALALVRNLIVSPNRTVRRSAASAAVEVVESRHARGDTEGAAATAKEFAPVAESELGADHDVTAALREAARP